MSSDGECLAKPLPPWLLPSTHCPYEMGVLLRQQSPEQRRKQKRSSRSLTDFLSGRDPPDGQTSQPSLYWDGGFAACLKNIRGHPLLENIFHAQLHTLFCSRMREDIELFLADGIEDHLRYLGGW